MSSKDTHLLKNWINALEKHPIEEAHRLHEDTLRIREMAKVAKEIEDKGLTETFAPALNEPYEASKVKPFGGKKAALHMILNWERKRDPKEPARIEMGRILMELGLHQLVSALNLLGVIKLT